MKLPQVIGALICRYQNKHEWGRAYDWKEPVKAASLGNAISGRSKRCKLCGLVRAVKTRSTSKFAGQKTLNKDSGLI